MKYVNYILLFIFTYTVFNVNVFASACSYKDQTILNNDLANIKITYEVIDDNKINVLIYNITENTYITYIDPDTKLENTIYFNNTTNGKYIIERDTTNLEEYTFKIRSNISDCYGNILSTKKIIKPKYNQFHTLEICSEKGLKNHSYCQKFVTKEINKTEKEVIKVLQEFLSERVEKITTSKVQDNPINLKTIAIYSVTGIIVVGIIVIVLLVKKKRSEL